MLDKLGVVATRPLGGDVLLGMATLLPLMETADATFLSQTDECWQKNIDWMLAQNLITKAPALDDVRVELAF